MLTIISRILHYGFSNFWRNGWPSAATVAIMILAQMVFIGLIFFNFVTNQAVATIQDKIDISVYFKADTPEDEILNVEQSLQSLPEVKGVEYISSDKAMENFRNRHQDDQNINRAITELDSNPFAASLNIKAHKPEQYSAIAQYLSSPNLSRYFDKVTYFQNQDVIDRLVAIISNVNRGGLALTVVLALIAGLVVFNTVRLAIYSSRDEIGIMRAVGASNALVRGPFMVEGVIAGVLAAVISIIVAAPLAYLVSPYFQQFIPDLNIFRYFYTHLVSLLGYQLLFGVTIGVFSSVIAIRRYLRN